ncbi:MAG: YncE family protein, partial [Calditrichaeota bacterium]
MKSLTLVVGFLVALLALACQSGDREKETGTHVEGIQPVATIPVGKGPDALFLTPDDRFLYVANVEDSTISVIDTRGDSLAATIEGIGNPWGFVRLGQSHRVAVSGYRGEVAVLDFTTHSVLYQTTLEGHPGGITATRDGATLFVVSTEKDLVYQLDAATLKPTGNFPTGKGPDGVGISWDDRKLYVTNTQDGTISIIQIADRTNRILKTGGKPELIHYNHDHTMLYISNFLLNKVHLLNTKTDRIEQEITGLDGPEEAVPSQDEKTLFVVNFNLSRVWLYRLPELTRMDRELVTGNKPIGVMPAYQDSKLYVTNYGDNSV